MLVRSLCNHYHDSYRKEGEEFDHSGPLYKHIKPVPEPVSESDSELESDPELESEPEPERKQKPEQKPKHGKPSKG